ncbi:MAG: zinc finger domain-containing protein, partial [Planctomycetota bacterium]
LAAALRGVLDESVSRGGTTLRDYASPDGRAGEFGERCAVYGRAGEPCDRCGGIIVRKVRQARSLYYCPSCQRG